MDLSKVIDLNKFIEWLKLPPKYLFAISVIGALLLFGPNTFIIRLGLDVFIKDYRKFIGIIFLAVNILLLAHFFDAGYFYYQIKIKNYIRLIKGKEKLHNLTPQEKKVLIVYINQNTMSQYLDLNSGSTFDLEKEQIIFRSSCFSHDDTFFDYNIKPWARDYLKENPDLIK